MLKNPNTKINQTVCWLAVSYHVFVTGTPVYNRAEDIIGYMAILQKPAMWAPATLASLNDPAINQSTNPFNLASTNSHYRNLILT
jgi:hypothetical protein